MKHVLIKMAGLCFIALLIQSCNVRRQQQLYYPNRANEPALNHVNDARINLSWNHVEGDEDRTVDGFSAQAAYSPINHLGIMGTFDNMYNRNSTFYKLNQGEFGAGYYLPFGRNDHWLFEIYGGYGFGKMRANNYYDSANNFRAQISASYNHLFMQPAIGYKGKHFSVIYGWKVLGRKFNDIRYFQNTFDTLYYNKRYTFFEPYLDATFGTGNYRINLQVVNSSQWDNYNKIADRIDGNQLFVPFFFPKNISLSLGVTIFVTPGMFDFLRKR